MAEGKKLKIGLALSGASGRAIAHIAVLEVLQKHNIPIDIIVGCSSGALISASYAVGTLDKLKTWFDKMTVGRLMKFWSYRNSRGGIFNLNTEEAERQIDILTHGLNFEDIKYPMLAMVATDLETGKLIVLKHGSINEAFKASVAVPGLLEPVVMDGKVLVDGGLVNIVPTQTAKELGADIVIGVNLSAANFIYEKKVPLWRAFRLITKWLGFQLIGEKILPKLSPRHIFGLGGNTELVDEGPAVPNIVTVMSKSIEHSFRIADEWNDSHVACDLMIEPGVKHYGKTEFFNHLEVIYQEGRRSAEEAIPKIQALIKNYEKKNPTVAMPQQLQEARA